MTPTCIVCKKEPIPFDDSRSFHKFPKDNELKTKWMNAIGKYSIKKTSKICSDHFDIGSYHNTDGYTTLRRLLSTAVPREISSKEPLLDGTNKVIDTSNKTVSENDQNTEIIQNIKIEENEISESEENTQVSECISNIDNANLISQSLVNKSNNKFDNAKLNYPIMSISPLETTEHTPYNDLKTSHNEIIKPHDHQNNAKSNYPILSICPLETVEHKPYSDLKISHDEIIQPHHHQDNAKLNYPILSIDPLKTTEHTSDSELKISHNEIIKPLHHQDNAKLNYPILSIDPLETTEHTSDSDLKISHNEIIKPHHHQNNCGNSNNFKRKYPFRNSANHTEIKKICHKGKFKKYCFTRQKFSSDEAWVEFQEFSIFIKNKIAAAAKQNLRKQKKLTSLKMKCKYLSTNSQTKPKREVHGGKKTGKAYKDQKHKCIRANIPENPNDDESAEIHNDNLYEISPNGESEEDYMNCVDVEIAAPIVQLTEYENLNIVVNHGK